MHSKLYVSGHANFDCRRRGGGLPLACHGEYLVRGSAWHELVGALGICRINLVSNKSGRRRRLAEERSPRWEGDDDLFLGKETGDCRAMVCNFIGRLLINDNSNLTDKIY
jgi:hypothetical protein